MLRERRPERRIVRERDNRYAVRRPGERALDIGSNPALPTTPSSRITRACQHEGRITSAKNVCLVEQQARRNVLAQSMLDGVPTGVHVVIPGDHEHAEGSVQRT